jgi:hypothetical protein
MTSTGTGDSGLSFGWINYALMSSGEKKKQFNPVGGEERFWIGPEGGQFAFYFSQGDSFGIDHWQVPALIDTEAFEMKTSGNDKATFTKTATVKNYSGTVFRLDISRTISLLSKKELEDRLHVSLPANVDYIGYESNNEIRNAGENDWSKKSGLLSTWLLGMFTPSAETKVIIPFRNRKDARALITDNYFGDIPAGRLLVSDSVLYFTCDGKYRSKIGLSPRIAKPIAASYDFQKNILTVISFAVEAQGNYVNSKWEIQKHPYQGDVVNAYNDGPMKDGTQLGPFYEIESSSDARELRKGETQTYNQATAHFQGDYATLNELAKKLLGVDLDKVR